MQLFFIGTGLKLNEAPEAIKRGSVLLISKYAAGAILGILIAKIFGPTGILGVSTLAIICSVTGANGSLYLALMGEYGDSKDLAAQSIMNIHDGPFLALLTFGVSGMANIPVMALFAAIVPLIIGCILGNLDTDIRKFFAPGVGLVIPFIGFALGAGINFFTIVKAGFSGVLLAAMIFIIGGGKVGRILAERFLKRGENVSVVEISDEECDKCIELGIRTVQGSAVDVNVLKKADIENAKYVVITTKRDDTNLLCVRL
jgi:2-keto-3-deoxygluconate permease